MNFGVHVSSEHQNWSRVVLSDFAHGMELLILT